MSLNTVTSPTRADEACSLRSLLTLGCRSRAEAFAKKLHTKLWSLGSMESSDQPDSGFRDHDVHTWVTVEARLDANSSVVTSVPVVSKVHREEQVTVRDDILLRNKLVFSNESELRNDDSEICDVLSYHPLGRESVDRESDASSTNKLSDSDQYFDFGIDSPVDPELEAAFTTEEEVIVVNLEDGLPSQPESGCVFTSPVLSGSNSSGDESEEDTSFYDVESLSQSPATLPGRTLAIALETSRAPSGDSLPKSSSQATDCSFSRVFDLNLLQNDVEKVILDKLPSAQVVTDGTIGHPGENVTSDINKECAAACPQITECSVQDAVSVSVEQEEQIAMVPSWQETISPAQYAEGTNVVINADVPVLATRESHSRVSSQGELEDVSLELGTPACSITQSTVSTWDEQPQVRVSEEHFCSLGESLLRVVCSDASDTVLDKTPEKCSRHEQSVLSRELRESSVQENVSCTMHPDELASFQLSQEKLLDINNDLLRKVEGLFTPELRSSNSSCSNTLKRVSESSSGYGESITSCDNDSDSCHNEIEYQVEETLASEENLVPILCPKIEIIVLKDDVDLSTNCPEKSQNLLNAGAAEGKKDVASDREEEDDEFTLRRHRVQRSTSLKSGKTPPGTPGRKKIVRFADALGLDLARVRTFMDEVPNVPQSAFKDLGDVDHIDDSPESQTNLLVGFNGPYQRRHDFALPAAPSTGFRTLIACFTSPGNLTDFLDRLKNQKVCLETAAMAEDMTIRGIIRCLNIDFHKSIVLRVTTDEWLSFTDVSAEYVVNSCDGLSDQFSFSLLCYSLQPGQRVIFAICYRVAGQEFWDSNFGLNYVFQCVAERASNSSTSSFLTSPTSNWMPYM